MEDKLVPADEAERVLALHSYGILDTPPEEVFDEIARLSAGLCEVPYVMISLVDSDRQWFKSHFGMIETQTPRDISFCQHAILQDDVFEVTDATEDDRFSSSPLVTGALGIRFYAGAPLTTPDGHALGTLCVMDTVTRVLQDSQRDLLKTLGQQVMAQLELRRSRSLIEHAESELDKMNRARAVAETAVNTQIDFLATIMESIAEGILTLDKNGRITFINRSAQQMLGWTVEEVVGRYLYEITAGPSIDGNTGPWQQNILDAVMSNGLVIHGYEDIFTSSSGVEFAVRCSLSPIVVGENISGIVLAFTDDTERKQAEREGRERERQIHDLADNVGALLARFDKDQRYQFCNNVYRKVLDMAPERVIGRTIEEVHGPIAYQVVQEYVEKALRGQSVAFEATFPNETHGSRCLHLTYTPEFGVFGEVVSVVSVAVDITERRQVESQLLHTQKLESIGQLAAGIAHELNTPIQYIALNARFLQDAFDKTEHLLREYVTVTENVRHGLVTADIYDEIDVVEQEDVEYLLTEIPAAIRQSLEGTERVASIVGAMKEFSHPGASEKSQVDLNRVVESTVIVSKHDWKYVANLNTDLDPNLPPIWGLPGELNQVMLNLIVNSAHAIGDVVGDGLLEKGEIFIKTSTVIVDGEQLAELRVSDTGTGISPAILPRIFDPFFTTKQIGKGTGQGLAIAHGIVVDKHKGTIYCMSTVGKGTTFIIRLPLAKKEP